MDLIKTSNPASVSPGDTFTYSITITNVGSLALQEVQVWDALPPTTTFVSATHGCQPGFIGHGQGVFCDLGALAVGESITIEIAVKAADDFTGTIVNQASACEFVSGRLGFACASGDVITTVAGAGSDVSFPDLIVQETSFDANCTLSITIQNIGNGFYNCPTDVSLTSVETTPGSGSFGTVVVTQFVTLNPKGETTFFLTGVKAENDTLTITIDPDGNID